MYFERIFAMFNVKMHTPEGVKDYLPEECVLKSDIEKNISAVFNKFGYIPVKSPTFEFMEVFDDDSIDSRVMYKFIDRDGSVLALRSDMTQAIARIAATAYSDDSLPMRFCYIDNSFRHNISYRGMLCEITQAGIELIGVNSVEADAEVIMVAIKSLKNAGLKSFKIDIGHAEFLQGIIEEAGFNEETAAKLRQAAIKKEYTTISQIAENSDINENLKSILVDLPFLIGGTEVLESVKAKISNEKSSKALEYLFDLYELIECMGFGKYISFDLSVMGSMDYYTGLIFRGYTEGTGFSIVDGGRYDNLVNKYGADYPAVGFSIKINELMSVIPPVGEYMKPRKKVLIAYTREGVSSALKLANALANQGSDVVELSLITGDLDKNKAYAANKGFSSLIYFKNKDELVSVNIAEDTEEAKKAEDYIKNSENTEEGRGLIK